MKKFLLLFVGVLALSVLPSCGTDEIDQLMEEEPDKYCTNLTQSNPLFEETPD